MSVSIRNLNIVIDGMPIVHDVDMDIADGERVGLIGSSGSVKSSDRRSAWSLCGHGVPESFRRIESGDDRGAAGRAATAFALRSDP